MRFRVDIQEKSSFRSHKKRYLLHFFFIFILLNPILCNKSLLSLQWVVCYIETPLGDLTGFQYIVKVGEDHSLGHPQKPMRSSSKEKHPNTALPASYYKIQSHHSQVNRIAPNPFDSQSYCVSITCIEISPHKNGIAFLKVFFQKCLFF